MYDGTECRHMKNTLRALIENGMMLPDSIFRMGITKKQKARMDLLKRVRKEMHRPMRRFCSIQKDRRSAQEYWKTAGRYCSEKARSLLSLRQRWQALRRYIRRIRSFRRM